MIGEGQLALLGLTMTEEEAFAEARRRWGNAAHVQVMLEHKDNRADLYPATRRYEVGELFMRGNRRLEDWHCHGVGATWEEAFAAADRRA